LNRGALRDPRVTVVNDDAMQWLQSTREVFDVIVVDFPDPHSLAVGKLYTTRFYAAAKRRLAHNGAMAVQSTSPLYSRASFWCIARTIEASGFHVRPYHAMVPAFGEWGFVLAAHHDFDVPTKLRASELRFLDDASLASLFVLSADMSEVPVEVNRLDNQVLVQLHTRDTRKWE
jgi:spermidine synthase